MKYLPGVVNEGAIRVLLLMRRNRARGHKPKKRQTSNVIPLKSSHIDGEMMAAGIIVAGFHVEAGSRTFEAYSRMMIGECGEAIRPYLKSFYEAVRSWPGFDPTGMSTREEVEAAISSVN